MWLRQQYFYIQNIFDFNYTTFIVYKTSYLVVIWCLCLKNLAEIAIFRRILLPGHYQSQNKKQSI